MEGSKKGGWGRVYLAVMCDPNIHPIAKAVYAYLAARSGAACECFPAVSTIVKELGLSKDTFYRHLDTLILSGIVEKSQTKADRGRFGRTVYRLKDRAALEDAPCPKIPYTDRPYSDRPYTDRPDTKEKKIKENKIKNNNEKYQQVTTLYNSICASFPKLTKLSDKRKESIRERLAQGYSMDDFKRLFELVEGSKFLKGDNNRGWRASFDWMITDANMAKTLDGNYSDRERGDDNATGTNKNRGSTRDFYESLVGNGNSDQNFENRR